MVLEGSQQPVRRLISLSEKKHTVTLTFEQRPRAIKLDPDFDVFRLLHAQERPSSFGRMFGASRQILVIPTNATTEQTAAWRQLADAWSRRFKNVELVNGAALKQLPEDSAVWLLGWNNDLLADYRPRFSSATQQLFEATAMVDNESFHAPDHAVVLLDPDNKRTPLGFLGADNPETISALARKLPHYSSYGRLVFSESDANNSLKHYLPVVMSPMQRRLTD